MCQIRERLWLKIPRSSPCEHINQFLKTGPEFFTRCPFVKGLRKLFGRRAPLTSGIIRPVDIAYLGIVKEQPYKLLVVLLQVLQELNQLRIVIHTRNDELDIPKCQ